MERRFGLGPGKAENLFPDIWIDKWSVLPQDTDCAAYPAMVGPQV
jgi:hypothetical protein